MCNRAHTHIRVHMCVFFVAPCHHVHPQVMLRRSFQPQEIKQGQVAMHRVEKFLWVPGAQGKTCGSPFLTNLAH